MNVCGFDGRAENVAEARRRFPTVPFEQADVQHKSVLELGCFDLVLSFGLVYHLENPFLAIRHLRALTSKCLLLESMCLPGAGVGMQLREEPRQDDQSLTDMACYASEEALVKMLYRAEFGVVYRLATLPDHEDFRETAEQVRRRTVLLACTAPLDIAGFRLIPEPREFRDPWKKDEAARLPVVRKIRRFVERTPRAKYLTLAQRMRRVFPGMSIPLRLPFGAWWLLEKSALDGELIHEAFESREMRFVEKLLRPGMTVVDAGAHHGLYTLLASKCVGREGRVLAFEPSPRECQRLEKHIRWNRSANVRVERMALGKLEGDAELFMVEGAQDWCNSLRPPAILDATRSTQVYVGRLDEVLSDRGVEQVDFLKLDVEGAELEVLQGATELLEGCSRPAVLAEVQDLRTQPWGYAAQEIISFLDKRNYRWFELTEEALLRRISIEQENYDANLVALPSERMETYEHLLAEKESCWEKKGSE